MKKTEDVMKTIDNNSSIGVAPFLIILVLVSVLSIGAGYLIAKKAPSSVSTTGKPAENNAKVEKTVGIADKKTFKDNAEGILKEGGLDGEGNFHLERPGGKSQNAYLTSSTVDLSQYIGKKVRVWGETFNASKAGWLMDVGFVEILK